jgi:hypothetical protein
VKVEFVVRSEEPKREQLRENCRKRRAKSFP